MSKGVMVALAGFGFAVIWGCGSPQPTNSPKAPTPSYSDGLPTNTTAGPAERTALAEGNVAFALDVYAGLRSGAGNLVFSPYSLSTALAMTYAGARGQTAQQIGAVLKFRQLPEKVHPAFAALIHDLHGERQPPGLQFLAANALWRQKGVALRDEFQQTIRANYGGVLKEVDFRGDPGAARQAVNDWVREKTGGGIQGLVPADLITAQTRVVLTNAVRFKSAWAKSFEKADSKLEPFHVSPDRKVNVTMMHQERRLKFFGGEDFQAVELPYKGQRMSMVVLLPWKSDGLSALERRLTPDRLGGWLSQLQNEEVHVALPRFRIASPFRLKELLVGLGMPDAFDPGKADLSGMSGGKGELFLTDAIHEASIEVNEEGTEATAGTRIGSDWNGAILFRADHPFLFLIRDNPTQTICFIGRFTSPQD
jgi:serpin B